MTGIDDPRRDDPVRARTPAHVRARIDRQTDDHAVAAIADGPEAIAARIGAIDREWNIDRVLMLNFALLGGLSHWLSHRRGGFWKWLFRTQTFFLGYHAARGWCPPVALFRRLGVRTQKEIDAERAELLAALERWQV